jgi:hypothetical protein
VRALDVALEDVFGETMSHLFPGNPLERLDLYQQLTESSLLVDVMRWQRSENPRLRELGQHWQDMLTRHLHWKMSAEKVLYFHAGRSEQTSIFSEPDLVLKRVRSRLPEGISDIPLKVDVARHYHRPSTKLPSGGQNYVFDPSLGEPRELDDFELFSEQPLSFAICRIYALDHAHDRHIQHALNQLLGESRDAKTNM